MKNVAPDSGKQKILDIFLDKICKEYTGKKPGASIGIIENNKLFYTKNYGLTNMQTKEYCGEKSNFRLASVTKQFTATCILQLIDKGKINLHDSIIKYFPQFEYAKEINIYNLLTHTSGLLDYEDLIRKNRINPISDREIIKLLARQKKLNFTPGSKWSYSNGAYCILKEIIEQVAGISFSKYLEKNIFKPLGLRNTVLSERGKTHIDKKATGYSINQKGGIIKTDNDITSYTMGDGSIYSNIEDLSKWIVGKHKILSKKLYKLSETPLELTDEKDTFYGFGVYIKKISGEKTIYHGGYSIGFRTGILYIPKKKIGVIFLSNLNKNEGSIFTEKIANFILKKTKENV